MKYAALSFFCVVTLIASAQRPTFTREMDEFMSDAYGKPVYTQQKYQWEGNIFFPENYSSATITSSGGKVYKNIKAKINLMESTVLFIDSLNREFVAALPIDKIAFDDYKVSFISFKNDPGKAFYQLLDSGKTTLLKKIYVTYKDQTPYGSTTVTRYFEQKQSYYFINAKVLKPLDKSREAILNIFSDKRKQVATFFENENLKLKKEEDLVKLFHYYNSL